MARRSSLKTPLKPGVPKPEQIASGLEQEIRSGVLAFGARLQSENELVQRFAVSRNTLRKGLEELNSRGLITTKVGIGSFVTFNGQTIYDVMGWSKALADEVQPLGIKVTCVEPGPFRTDFAGRSLAVTPSQIPDYAEKVGKRLAMASQMSGTQAGDPVRAAKAIVTLSQETTPPAQVVLGKSGFDIVVSYLRRQLDEVESRRDFGIATDYPGT